MADTIEDRARTRYAERYREKWGFDPDRWCPECEDHPALVPSAQGHHLVFSCAPPLGHASPLFGDKEDERYCPKCLSYGLHLEPDPDDAPFLRNVCSYCGDVAGDHIKPEEARHD